MGSKMHEIMRGVLLNTLRVTDVGLIMLSFGLAAVLTISARKWTMIASVLASKVSLSSCVLFATAILLCHAMFSLSGLYQSKRMSTKASEAADVLRAMTLSTACLWCEGSVFYILLITPMFLLSFWVIGSATVIAARLLVRSALGAIRKRGRNVHHVLVLGTNARAIEFGRRTEAMPERGFRVLGFVDEDWSGTEKFKDSGFPLACHFDGLPDFLRKNALDEIAIYLPLRSFYERSAEIVQLAKQHGILVRFDTDIFDLKFARHHAEATGDVPQIVVSSNDIDGWQLLMKRIFDVIGSLVMLILLSPLFLIVAILIKLTSPGTVFFAQRRIGLNKRQFTMYKFRTMVPAAESIQEKLAHLNEMTGPVFKIKNDPRITPLGRVLRRTSIDELPQLFNVLKGDMSLVGPRAIPVRDYELFSEDWHRRRFSVSPGVTCLWQVSGRNSIPFEQWMMLDMQYIDRWSLWLDIKILALTIPAVLKGSGAA
jgi:exopolysaccharide biosynthesis polyprenyl glycosylphosphotransferase